ncbi:MAG: SIMPL domain-containing protein [Castellaniella sp.]|jgi:predicted secreted protein|uniref:SIMPL domain-containing protein n=1 Tax=Castellaniella sp. TaxID=1955812 RepID=UPI003C72B584
MYRGVRNRKQLLVGSLLALSVLALPALAHEAHEPAEPRASLSAEASSEVGQDTVEITLAAELSGKSQTQVAETLNQRLDSVMKQAKGHEGIEARSGSYRIWPTTDRDGKIAEWRGQAEILLESRDFPAVSKLAASLGDRMPIAGLAFSVSRERRAAEEQKLLGQAVEAFKARAQALTQALGFADYRFRTVDLGGQGAMPYAPAPRMMMSAMAAEKTAAPVEGGRERISVSVQGTIVLLPK